MRLARDIKMRPVTRSGQGPVCIIGGIIILVLFDGFGIIYTEIE